MRLLLIILVSLIVAGPLSAADAAVKPGALEKYQKCVTLSVQDDAGVADLLNACRETAEAGIPGAQYALGVALFGRNEAGDRTAAMEWLDKAAASGNPAAAFAF